jgi:hypothetical protein
MFLPLPDVYCPCFCIRVVVLNWSLGQANLKLAWPKSLGHFLGHSGNGLVWLFYISGMGTDRCLWELALFEMNMFICHGLCIAVLGLVVV